MRRAFVCMFLLLCFLLTGCTKRIPLPTPHISLPVQSGKTDQTADSGSPKHANTGDPKQSADPAAPQDPLEHLSACVNANKSTGGFAVEDEHFVYFISNGLWRMEKDGAQAECLYEGQISDLSLSDGKLYFLSLEYGLGYWEDINVVSHVPCSINTDGSELKYLGAKKPVGSMSDYNWELDEFSANVNAYVGYKGFCVQDGWAYYLTDIPTPGAYYTISSEHDGFLDDPDNIMTVTYDSSAALVRQNLQTGEILTLAQDLGNASPSFCLDGDSVYYTSVYSNAAYSYDFTDYFVCDTNGGNLRQLSKNEEHSLGLVCSAGGSNNDIVTSIQAKDGDLYASQSDSEGDFRDSRLMRIKETEEELVLYETNYVQSLLTPMGILCADGERDWETDIVDGFGLYLRKNPAAEKGQLLVSLPHDNKDILSVNLVDGWVYLNRLYAPLSRIRLTDGRCELFADGAWSIGSMDTVHWREKTEEFLLSPEGSGTSVLLADLDLNNLPELFVFDPFSENSPLRIFSFEGDGFSQIGALDLYDPYAAVFKGSDGASLLIHSQATGEVLRIFLKDGKMQHEIALSIDADDYSNRLAELCPQFREVWPWDAESIEEYSLWVIS